MSAPGAPPTVRAFDHAVVMRYTALVTVLGFLSLGIPVLAGLPVEPFLLVLTYGGLLGGSVFAARRAGPGGVRLLFRGLLRWRIGWVNAAVVLGAVPLATIAVAVVTGTYVAPEDGWLPVLGSYAFAVIVYGLLLLNVWEETGWQGMIQRHLMDRHGLLRGAALTAIPFAVVHIPLQLQGASDAGQALVDVGVLLAMAPAARYLAGRTDYATGGSLLAVALLHASWNASGSLSVVDGEAEYVVGLVVVTAVALAVDVARSRSHRGVLSAPAARRFVSSQAVG